MSASISGASERVTGRHYGDGWYNIMGRVVGVLGKVHGKFSVIKVICDEIN